MLARLFYTIYQRILAFKWMAALAMLVLLGLLIFQALQIRFEEDISKLIPVDEENEELYEVLGSLKFKDKIIVNISRSDGVELDEMTSFARTFVDSLDAKCGSLISSVQGVVKDDDLKGTIDFAYAHLPLLLEEQDYETIAERLNKDAIDEATGRNFRTLISPSGLVAREGILRDPVGLTYIALEHLQELGVSNDLSIHHGFLMNSKKSNILLLLGPSIAGSETDRNAKLVDRIGAIQSDLRAEFGDRVDAEIFGSPVVAVANARQIKKDIQVTVSIAMGLLLLCFILFYRNLAIPFVLFIPTAVGALVAVAVLSIIRTDISAISLGIGAVLIGITLDYSLHILTHLRNGSSVKELYDQVAKPVLMSSLTTAVAFCCLLFIRSQALQDLGIFAAISVLLASTFALVFIPLVYRAKSNNTNRQTVLDRLAGYSFHKNKYLLAGLLGITLIGFFKYGDVRFNNDLNEMNYFPAHLQAAQSRLDSVSDFSSHTLYLTSFARTADEALAQNEVLRGELDELEAQGKIGGHSSVGGLALSEATQQKRLQRWASFWSPARKDTTKSSLIQAGHAHGFKEQTFGAFYDRLDKPFEPMILDDLRQLALIELDDFVSVSEQITTVNTIVRVDPKQEVQLKSIYSGRSGIMPIDRKEINESFLGKLKEDFNQLIAYSLIAVTILLLLFFRDVPLTVITLIPICLTWVVTIGTMALLNIEFNIFNIIISTFIFGLGIDYSIFITNGLLARYRTGQNTLPTYRTSILLSLLTTMLGIGVLIFAKHPALYTISVVCLIGVFAAVLMAFTLQPLLFKLLVGGRDREPTSVRELLFAFASFTYYGIGGILFSIVSTVLVPFLPISKKKVMRVYHTVISKFTKSVLFTNPFVSKKVINEPDEDFQKPGMIISNHSSFLDILTTLMLNRRIIILVNDWVYNSPVFGKAVQLAGFYPVSKGIEDGLDHLRTKVAQGYNLMAFPEGSRSTTNKLRRFHKGAFFLAEELRLDIIPVLIHGNSEVLPKGDFIIRDGKITVNVLPRIPVDSSEYGNTSRERTRNISTYFKQQLEELRNSIEVPGYFNRSLKAQFKYAGARSYTEVKRAISNRQEDDHKIMRLLNNNEHVVLISNGCGYLATLLHLHQPRRKIDLFLSGTAEALFMANGFRSPRYAKLNVVDSLEEALQIPCDTLIVDVNTNIFEGALKTKGLVAERVLTVVTDKLDAHNEINFLGFSKVQQWYSTAVWKKESGS